MPFLLAIGRVDLLFKRKGKKSAPQASEMGSQSKIWSLQSKRYSQRQCCRQWDASQVAIEHVRGRRKSSQKLAERRAFVCGGGVSTLFAKQASKKKKKGVHVDFARCAPPCPARKSIGARSSGKPVDWYADFSFQTLPFFCVLCDFPFFQRSTVS